MERKFPVVKDPDDDRDFKYSLSAAPVVKFPDEIDWSEFCSPVGDQLNFGACTGWGIGRGMREYMLIKNKETFVQLAPMYLYRNERALEGTLTTDSGARVRDGMKLMQSVGICPEVDFAYTQENFAATPSAQADANALKYRIAEYHRVMSFDEVKQALVNRDTVVMGLVVFESFESYDVYLTGIVPVPTEQEKILGGHCMHIVGYKTMDGVEYVKVKNSWGTAWGQGGYCFIPRGYFDSGYIMDLWVGVEKRTEQSITFDEAIKTFVDKNIFSTPDFWTAFESKFTAGTLTNNDFRYVTTGFIKIANFIDPSKAITSFADAVSFFVGLGIFISPDFWTAFQSKYLAGKLTNADFTNVLLGFRKLAAYVINN